ncbi:hypothetical protein Sjap_025087 [Stephania japonica]|uniref:Uncharacterized protein n=1 Tax=Stephania japonica TaxID=461633 RepID=A0AAP0HHM0_9MAGN
MSSLPIVVHRNPPPPLFHYFSLCSVVLLDNGNDKDITGYKMPNLVYIVGEKSKSSTHHFMAGALNIQIPDPDSGPSDPCPSHLDVYTGAVAEVAVIAAQQVQDTWQAVIGGEIGVADVSRCDWRSLLARLTCRLLIGREDEQ